MGRLFLLFTLVPLGEVFLLFRIADHVGGLATLALVIATGMFGAWLARREGLRVIRDWQRALAQGRVPEHGVIHGLLVLVGGLLLVTPGVITDCVGLVLLLPPSRAVLARVILERVERAIREGRIRVTTVSSTSMRDPFSRPQRPQIIDVEGEAVER